MSQIYLKYAKEFPKGTEYYCCESKFREYVHSFQIFIDPTRDSDLCGYCGKFKALRKTIGGLNNIYKRSKNLVGSDEIDDNKEGEEKAGEEENGEAKIDDRPAAIREIEKIAIYPLIELKSFVSNHPRLPKQAKQK